MIIIDIKKMPDPKKGTGKKPKGSGRRLYTDENRKGLKNPSLEKYKYSLLVSKELKLWVKLV
jgi:hypothetical protein